MKTHKITKLLGIGLTLMLLVSMLAIAAPVTAKDPGDQQWANGSEPGPSAIVMDSGSDVNRAAVGSDGVCYFVSSTASDPEVKRLTSGNVGASLANYAGATPKLIAVAPDNSDCIAVVDTNEAVYISNDKGVTWSTLPVVTGSATGGDVMAISIAPARSGTLLGREYAVAVADNTISTTTLGDVLIIGGTAAWASVATLTGAADFMTLKFAPNYAGTRVLMAVGVTALGAKNFYLMNTSTNAQLTNSPITFVTALAGDDYAVSGVASTAYCADIAVASDFDPTDANAYRAWVSFGSVGGLGTDDVFRIDGPAFRDLNAVTSTTRIDTISYSGTNDAGTLFVGYCNATPTSIIKRTANPQSNTPTWTTTKNQPTGSTFTNVIVSPDFGSTNRVYAGTAGAESAWSNSMDGGVSFYQTCYIDNGASSNVVAIDAMAVSADGSTMYWVTDDGTDLHVWKNSSMPPSAMGYKRVYTVLGAGGTTSLLALNPDWETSPSVFVLNAPGGTDQIYVSHNDGATWTIMQGPATGTDTFAAADAQTLYATNGNNFYKSTNAGWTWDPAVAWYSSGTGQNIALSSSGRIFIGRTGGIVRMSTDGGASWASQGTTGYPSNPVFALPDENYDTEGAPGEGILYRQDLTTGTVYRYDKNDGSGLVYSLGNTGGGTPVGLAQVNGVLYAMNSVQCDRSLYSRAALSTAMATWEIMDMTVAELATWAGKGGVTTFAVTADNVLWVTSPQDDLWGYKDYMASAKTVVTSPPEGYALGVDPVNGRADILTLAWDAMGSGTAVVDQFDISICEKALGWGAPVVNTNGTAPANPAAPSVTVAAAGGTLAATLRANTEYMVRVRADDQVSNDAIRSSWSDAVNFTVQAGGVVQAPQAGPQILGPAGGSTTTLTPGFSWAPIAGATEYEFILATDAGLSQTLAGTPATLTAPAFQSADALDYSTTYFWAVRVSKPTAGVQTIGTFTTMAEPEEPIPPVVVEPPAPAPPAPPAIPAAAVWAVIGIGAILVVAVLVLIVRTRRPL